MNCPEVMNQPLLLHMIERLEGFLGKLPTTIQRPILSELTPLKELFLQQRPPRFVLTGSSRLPVQEIIPALFASERPEESREVLSEIFRWQDFVVDEHGTIALLDARGADDAALSNIRDQLKSQPADIFFFLADGKRDGSPRQREIENLSSFIAWNDEAGAQAKAVGIICRGVQRASPRDHNGAKGENAEAKLRSALASASLVRERLLQIIDIPIVAGTGDAAHWEAKRLMSLVTQYLPNEARVEMIRVSREREAQVKVAQILVKSTSAICTAVGAQPIPLADLPILTALQLVMVSGIMYISGRERSVRAATEFIAALGANVGAGMLLREGTRVVLKFFPGWGNVVCGMVAGAGTYAVGRASIVYFLEGLSLKEARRAYLTNRKKPIQRGRLEQARGAAVRAE
jgi:uncharacterized protein (DUF697 family)